MFCVPPVGHYYSPQRKAQRVRECLQDAWGLFRGPVSNLLKDLLARSCEAVPDLQGNMAWNLRMAVYVCVPVCVRACVQASKGGV